MNFPICNKPALILQYEDKTIIVRTIVEVYHRTKAINLDEIQSSTNSTPILSETESEEEKFLEPTKK